MLSGCGDIYFNSFYEESGQHKSESYEILYTQTFRTQLEYRIGNEFRKLFFAPAAAVGLGMDERLQRIPHKSYDRRLDL